MLYDVNGKIIAKTVSKEDIAKGYISMETELKKAARHSHGGFGSFPTIFPHPAVHGRLGFPVLRHLYETSASVRPAVDGITREIAGLPWMITHEDGKWHPGDETKRMSKFFKKVNFENESIGTVISKFLNDYLVLGRAVIEKARNPLGQIVELLTRDASLFQIIPTKDLTGILAYRERKRNSLEPIHTHSKSDIIYRQYSPITYTHMSIPIIETIVNEISLLLLSTKNIAWAFVNDEIPPGILHLGEIGEEALKRAQLSFEGTRGIAQASSGMRVVDNVDKVNWVSFQRPFREMQVAELIPIFERVVSRNFGLAAVETGLTNQGGRGNSEVALKASQSKMIIPLTVITSDALNEEVIEEMNPDLVFSYTSRPGENSQEKSEQLLQQQREGVLTRNEVRVSLGRKPVKGGDLFTVKLGNEVVPFDEDTGEPIFRNPIPGGPTPSDIARQQRRDEGIPQSQEEARNQNGNSGKITVDDIFPSGNNTQSSSLDIEEDDSDEFQSIVPSDSPISNEASHLKSFPDDPIVEAIRNFKISNERFKDMLHSRDEDVD
jgi:hypothetical protein